MDDPTRIVRARAGVACVAAWLALSGCAHLHDSEARRHRDWQRRVEQVVDDAQATASDGQAGLQHALDILQSAREEGVAAGYGDDATLLFSLAWLHDEFASSWPDGSAQAQLEEAVRLYQRVIELIPPSESNWIAQTSMNLALVRHRLGQSAAALAELRQLRPVSHRALVIEGDISRDQGELEAALAAYERAFTLEITLRSLERRDVAASRLVRLMQSALEAPAAQVGGSFGPRPLLAWIDRFTQADLLEAALHGCEVLVAKGSERYMDEALCRWVECSARRADLTYFGISRLRRLRDSPRLESALDGLERILALSEPMEDPDSTYDNAVKEQGYWLTAQASRDEPVMDATALRRRYAFSCALQSIARDHALYSRIHEAAAILERTVARDQSDDYLLPPSGADYAKLGQLDGLIDIGLDMTLDLVLLLYNFQTELDTSPATEHGGAAVSGARLHRLLKEDKTLVSFSDEDAQRLARPAAEIERVHTVLGLVYADWEGVGWRGPAQYHLMRALKKATEIRDDWLESVGSGAEPTEGESHRIPYSLLRRIGNGLSQGQAAQAFRSAALGYIEDNQDRRAAREVYRDALAAFRRSERDLLELERMVYPRARFYIGGNFGVSRVDSSAGELTTDLLGIDPTFNVDVQLDSSAQGWKAYLGKRFNERFEAELAFVDLGGPESAVTEAGAPNAALPDAVRNAHPRTAEGLALSAVWTPIRWSRWTAGARLGGWYWDSELLIDLQTSGGVVPIRDSREGVDLLYGAKVEYQFDWKFSLRAEYERYGLDSDEVSLLSFGLTYLL